MSGRKPSWDSDFIVELFAVFGPVSVRRMFSGAGVFADGLMIALVVDGVIYLTLPWSMVMAVDAKTGKRKWHYQLVHHGIWDMDIPCAPILANITVNGKQIKALAQPTKQAFLFDYSTRSVLFEREADKRIAPGDVIVTEIEGIGALTTHMVLAND